LLIWRNFAQIERNSPEIFGAKLNCADSPISGEKNNYCVWDKNGKLLTYKDQVLFRWKEHLEQHLKGGAKYDQLPNQVDLNEDGVEKKNC
jgi:hypothetical protein